jgi:hypothetical protein
MARIFQTHVNTLFAEEGPVDVLLLGEAPGPRGADQSGVPFWGDRAGIQVYRALVTTGRAMVPDGVFEAWDGAKLRDSHCFPRLFRTALGNAFPRCPTRDGLKFRAPTDSELMSPENQRRLLTDLETCRSRCDGTLSVITLGKRASFALHRIGQELSIELHQLPHPSSQGLLQAAPGKGKGLKLADLQRDWESDLMALL